MKERPILFSGEMVRAILDGRKTVTRRVVKAKHLPFIENILGGFLDGKWNQRPMPYGQPGDRLWVREAFVLESNCGDFVDNEPPFKDGRPVKRESHHPEDGSPLWLQPHYRATDPTPELVNEDCPFERCANDGCCQHWKPSIHMPRWASRITLEVTGVRVERVQDITEEQMWAEGIERSKASPTQASTIYSDYAHPRRAFQLLWDEINEGRGFGWDKNPWVWVIEFKRLP